MLLKFRSFIQHCLSAKGGNLTFISALCDSSMKPHVSVSVHRRAALP